MPPAPDIRQKAIALIGQLPQDKLMAVVQLLEFLAEPPQQSTVSAEEAQLLEAIENHLPEDKQARLDTLRDRLNSVTDVRRLCPLQRLCHWQCDQGFSLSHQTSLAM